ncbi:extracellular solute-binding protein [Streptomyces tricolor]|nr:extracellular solute-binding protein [Streptomyces tricolor]
MLQLELDKFEKQTGIKVELEVVPWSDLLNRIPDRDHLRPGPGRAEHRQHLERLLQATGALLPWDEQNFAKIGGRDRFAETALGSIGVPGKDPAAVPLYSMAYALYYNKEDSTPTPASASPRPPGTS